MVSFCELWMLEASVRTWRWPSQSRARQERVFLSQDTPRKSDLRFPASGLCTSERSSAPPPPPVCADRAVPGRSARAWPWPAASASAGILHSRATILRNMLPTLETSRGQALNHALQQCAPVIVPCRTGPYRGGRCAALWKGGREAPTRPLERRAIRWLSRSLPCTCLRHSSHQMATIPGRLVRCCGRFKRGRKEG